MVLETVQPDGSGNVSMAENCRRFKTELADLNGDVKRKTRGPYLSLIEFLNMLIWVRMRTDSAQRTQFGQTWTHELPWIRFALPEAPVRPVTLNFGMAMPAWYDIHGLEDRLQEPAVGAEESRAGWASLLESEASEVGSRDRVVLGGFSQGAAMALYTAMHLDMQPMVAGVLMMSGYLPNYAAVANLKLPRTLLEIPVLMCHGQLDGMVRLDMAKRTKVALQELGFQNVELREYEGMGHEVCEAELEDVADWLGKIIPSGQE